MATAAAWVGAALMADQYDRSVEAAENAQNQARQRVDDANQALAEGTTSDAERRRASFEAAARQRSRAAGSGGRASTILTGPLGLTDEPSGRRKTLLGA